MRGIPYFNFPKFDEIDRRFRAAGWDVVNPAELDRQVGFDPAVLPRHHDWNEPGEDLDLRAAARRDADAITKSDAIALLPGWKHSTGVGWELPLAKFCKLYVFDLETMIPPAIDNDGGFAWVGSRRQFAFAGMHPGVNKVEDMRRPPLSHTVNVPARNIEVDPNGVARLRGAPEDAEPACCQIQEGAKHDDSKSRVDLLSWPAMKGIGDVLKFGATKYAPDNWRRGFAWRRLIGAALRHLFAFADGEDDDPESGLSHIDHAACCVMFLSEHQKRSLGEDDRYIASDNRTRETAAAQASGGIPAEPANARK